MSEPTDNTREPLPDSAEYILAQAHRNILRGDRRLSSSQAVRESGVPQIVAQSFWRALGFANADDTEQSFTEADVWALQFVAQRVSEGDVDLGSALAITRALGRSLDRMASWQVQIIDEVVSAHGAGTPAELAQRVEDLVNDVEPILGYVWRRHVAAHLSSHLAQAAGDQPRAQRCAAVGFADLVSFTATVRELSEHQLAALVQEFEDIVADIIISNGGNVVKTVGDEVFFACEQPAQAATIGCQIVAAVKHAPELPPVRVGLAYGPVITRMGDVYGTTVNRAARLTGAVEANRVLVDAALMHELNGLGQFVLGPLQHKALRSFGEVACAELFPA